MRIDARRQVAEMHPLRTWARTVEGVRSRLLELQTLLERQPTETTASDLRVLMRSLRDIVDAARACGLFVYASITLRILERVEPSTRLGHLPASRVEMLSRWVTASLGYLQEPHSRTCALQLVDQLAAEPGEAGCAEEEVNGLLCDLLQEPMAPPLAARPRSLKLVRQQ